MTADRRNIYIRPPEVLNDADFELWSDRLVEVFVNLVVFIDWKVQRVCINCNDEEFHTKASELGELIVYRRKGDKKDSTTSEY